MITFQKGTGRASDLSPSEKFSLSTFRLWHNEIMQFAGRSKYFPLLIFTLFLGYNTLPIQASAPAPIPQSRSAETVSSAIEIGWGKVEITPPIGTPLAGYGKRKGRPSLDIHDPLYARALAVTRGRERLVFVSTDLVLIDQKLRSSALKKIRKKISFKDSELILTATHTHSGAGAIGGRFWERFIMGGFRKKVFEHVSSGIAKAVLDAIQKKIPASLEMAEVDVSDLIENRMDENTHIPRRLKVLRFVKREDTESVIAREQNDRSNLRAEIASPPARNDKSVLAHLIFLAAHPTILPASNLNFSADFPGELNQFLETDYPESISLMINGAAADLRPKTPYYYPTRFQTMKAYGFSLAEKIKALNYHPAPVEGPWKSEIMKVNLPNTKIRLGRFTVPFLLGNRIFPSRTYFHAARMGQLLFLTFPGELSSEVGASLESLAKSRRFIPFIVGYAHDYIAYVVPRRFYSDRTQYEARVSFYGPKMDWLIQNPLNRLMFSLLTPEEKSILNPPGVRSGNRKLPVLTLAGDPYHAGFEEGRLLRDEIHEGVDSIFDYLRSEFPVPLLNRLLINYALDRAWRQLEPYVNYLEYLQMQGLADGAGISLKTIQRVHALPEVFPTFCANSAFWGKATSSGKMMAIRNLDWNRKIGVHHHATVKFIQIPGKQRYANIGYQGFIGVLSGMNEKGITVGQIGAASIDETMKGVPMPFLLKRVLEESENLADIHQLLENTNRTRGYNYIFTDAAHQDALAVESTWKHLAFFKENDPLEKQAKYSVPIKSCVLRADTALDSNIRDLQWASKGNPKKPGLEPPTGSAYEIRYRKHAKLIQENYGAITPEIAKKIAAEIAPRSNIQSVIYAFPEFWVANAEDSTRAVDSEYTHFDLEDTSFVKREA
ncbi:MAG: hypothetical protein EXS63_06425 [Candidatus Omnitrophica bacterium]|nr:hypothetical protein [Candidatus Omnitrophota bacterium]